MSTPKSGLRLDDLLNTVLVPVDTLSGPKVGGTAVVEELQVDDRVSGERAGAGVPAFEGVGAKGSDDDQGALLSSELVWRMVLTIGTEYYIAWL